MLLLIHNNTRQWAGSRGTRLGHAIQHAGIIECHRKLRSLVLYSKICSKDNEGPKIGMRCPISAFLRGWKSKAVDTSEYVFRIVYPKMTKQPEHVHHPAGAITRGAPEN
jgi:hypothetical protein